MEFLMKILAIGAHFDDIEIGCGGTLTKHVQNGDEIHFAVTSSDEFRNGSPTKRYLEMTKSVNLMGIQYHDIKRFKYEYDAIHDVIGELDEINPDIVFTQHAYDTHQDHQRAFLIGQAVARKKHITTLFYDSGSAYDFNPNLFSIIDWKMKLSLLECYESQINCGAIKIDLLKKKDSYWASLVTSKKSAYAEGFVGRKMKWIV